MMNKNHPMVLRVVCWAGFEVIIPIFFVVAIWPISAAFLQISFAFEKTLGSADLLPIGSVLLLGVAIDAIFAEFQRATKSMTVAVLAIVACLVALVFLFLYGFAKAEYLRYSFPASGTVDTRMVLFAYLSGMSIIFAVIFSLLVKLSSLSLDISPTK